jgi:capsular exopolysaccharide synthesis family protein
MSRVYDALRRAAAEEQKNSPAPTIQMPATADFNEESFPAEITVGQGPAAPLTAAAGIAAHPTAVATSRFTTLSASSAPAGTIQQVTPVSGVDVAETFDRIAARYEGKTVIESEISPQSREQYRRLAASLHHAQATSGTKVIMFTSALVGEGKTLTSSNVALTLSQSYQKQVLLVDADLRRPSLQAVFGIRTGPGLSEGLTADRERAVPVHQVSSRLGILQAGRPTSDPIAALTSERMRRLVEEARKTFDWIILDTPPVALLTDASLVSSMTDGVILVVKAGSTPHDLVERAVAAIGRERTLGVVLNHAELPIQGSGYYGDYYYYYGGAPK